MSILQPDAQVKLEGEKVYPRAKSSYEEGINRQLKSSVFYRNKLTFDAESLRKKIEAAFPEVNETNIAISLFRHRPVVEIRLAKPTTKLITEDRVYILDEEGRALFEQKDASKQLDTESLLTIRDSSGQSIELGKPALAESQIGYIREIIGQMKAYKKLKPRFFLLSNGGTGLNVRFDGLSYYARFSFYADPRQSSGAFIALYEQFNREGTAPSEYVDLRIPEKAFVK
ncbi:MAG TPA: hypothetical protein VFX86_01575 [Candidatus Saccharimonadales bacterium]|nr:hypothetical protein [Candidatus Saccharimonadales bacterium]